MFEVKDALRELVSKDGSDLHLKVGSCPLHRVHGELTLDRRVGELTTADTEEALRALLDDEQKLADFDHDHEVDFSYEIEGVARYRINAFRQRGTISLVCRAIPHKISTIEELALPDVVRELAEEERGIVLLTGTTGSGKSTTLAAMIDHINQTMSKHIVTIEDPIEFVHEDKRSAINQREVGMDTASFKRALRRVLRQDPDVILVGEMRDQETVAAALSAAETGHLVFSTLHTINATETINRIVDFFPPHQQTQIRISLAGSLQGIVCQRLIPTVDGESRVPALEVLVINGRIQQAIVDPLLTGDIDAIVADGAYYGMVTFDQSLAALLATGRITLAEAMATATNPHDLKVMLERQGILQTGSFAAQLG